MSSFKITKWNGKELEALVEYEQKKRLTRAAIFLQNEVKKELGTKGVKCNTNKGERSEAGEPPHLECGLLRQSITYEVDGEVARVGTNVKYGKFLELSTSRMAARPFLRPALDKNRDEITRMLAEQMPGL